MKARSRVPGWVLSIIEALDAPAALCDPRGRVRHTNAAGRATVGWRDAPTTRRVALRVGGRDATLLVADRPVGDRARAPAWPLPPSLARVATLAATGMPDAAIAASTGLAHSTVRTYVTRIYERLGVVGRAALAAWQPR